LMNAAGRWRPGRTGGSRRACGPAPAAGRRVRSSGSWRRGCRSARRARRRSGRPCAAAETLAARQRAARSSPGGCRWGPARHAVTAPLHRPSGGEPGGGAHCRAEWRSLLR
jgi:hypothetical protein